ncbi:MAG: hypothetical protein FJ100_11950 [Deltaproteobacteria bacterium]|nr:hypothetical protein [Deltaproteobacteria bacterium]
MPAPLPLTAADLMPLVSKLSPAERARLGALVAACGNPTTDADRYAQTPANPEEFQAQDGEDPLAWDGHGWEEFYAPR